MTLRPLDTLLIAAVLLIGIGQLYLIFGKTALQSAQQTVGAPMTQGTPANTPNVQQAPTVPIPSNSLTPTGGVVQSIEGNTIVLKGQNNNTQEQRITTTPNTTIVLQGAKKDQATIEKEMQAFHDQSRALADDPTKNHDALATLIAPSPFIETKIAPSDIKTGDSVSAFVKGGTALKVTIFRK